ncbi:hypothetical protein B9Q04_19635 [Candidatus Marsarchaeota G2 archaeon BE_D]|uniref:Uncharacterized protein n=4 Tax=Candidatus Marsarchaeota group 2 TaxID=2203771 RepID=A0A2R6BZY8_9ARCH|nr:MAG: hypothetical protein B9Q06_11845 [Candidatus Marsarchaeota G2 archaeon ECH_B_2]PSN97963.1 MAG: hypothetical protein B9Q07_11045 [Candidatus Marsarchaeota G2 archaeon ECH_B_3]PSN99391.1 MAG: hypothetical protein B9Q05_11795 [Candidatus Marsarchaeota G2 archaeon ECH_B_1]PSO04086.1 MAG: hypothetical protein B9Q04_19635 [Candidatus Marsarchaeota G2 archaeon BE_D]
MGNKNMSDAKTPNQDKADRHRWTKMVARVLEALKQSGVEPKDYLLSMPYIIAYMMEDQSDEEIRKFYDELVEITIDIKHIFNELPQPEKHD